MKLIDHPRHTEGERDCGFADPFEAELGPEECPHCGGTDFILGTKERCPTCQPYEEPTDFLTDKELRGVK